MASRIAVMDKGAVQQIATPSELYEQPASRFVADFIGKVNLIRAKVVSSTAKKLICEARGLGKVELPHEGSAGGEIAIAVRPEKLRISEARPKAARAIKAEGKVRDVAYYGDTSHVVVRCNDDLELSVNVQNDTRAGGSGIERGQKVWIHWAPEDTLVLTE
jgi:ABC-type Fe3+/spermidine/putrescine transport system ATPase subunit